MENSIQINISKGKIVNVSFDAYKHQEYQILDPTNQVVCDKNTKPDSNSSFLFENQFFSAEIGGDYTIIIKSNHIEQEIILTDKNEIFVGSEVTKLYNFKSCEDAEMSLVVH